ncbi:hypothetical protein ACFSTE_02020 [Aquimarina hainanensis]|uniref:SnoaL-like domain-containing protein n=1 Tax=Aquimarina hainanensis TaxID=1578017 RepID=A0ABW5N382_9FLAO|nr:hypothetical protein [Aquimarina sp. TRL1]QKX04306.1 hypothetical protein HN014_05070 [Aquimarina sp. TRL1]
MKKITIIIVALLTSFSVQNIKAADYDEPVRKLLSDYVNMVNGLNQGVDKETVLELFSESYVGNTAYVRLSGTVVRKRYKKEDLARQIDDIVGVNKYKFRLSLDKVLYVSQKERAGTISALVTFESLVDGKLAEKGTMLMNLVGTYQSEGWKIVQNNIVRVSETKDVGDCVCYVYAKGSTKFVTEIYFPAGVEYGQDFVTFRVTTKDEDRIIKSGNKDFVWSKETGELTYKGASIGTAEDSKKAIEAALKDMYKESCLKILFN